MTNAPAPLTRDDLLAGLEREDWNGWGYLGGRDDVRARYGEDGRRWIEDRIVGHANANGWTAEDLFQWANSRQGRHFADDPHHPKADTLLTLEGLR